MMLSNRLLVADMMLSHGLLIAGMMLSHLLLVASMMLAPKSKFSVPGSFEDETLLICIIYRVVFLTVPP